MCYIGTMFANEIPLERQAKAPFFSRDKLKQVVNETKKYFRMIYWWAPWSVHTRLPITYSLLHSIGRIRLKMCKWDSFKPGKFAALAQRHHNATITAIQEWAPPIVKPLFYNTKIFSGNDSLLLLLKLSTETASLVRIIHNQLL